MSDIAQIAERILVERATRPRGYQAAREVTARATHSREVDSPVNQRAIDRLDRVLQADKPPRDDVPKGFYINIQV